MKRLIALLALAAALVACSPSDGGAGSTQGAGSTTGTDLGSPALESPALSSPGLESPAASPSAS